MVAKGGLTPKTHRLELDSRLDMGAAKSLREALLRLAGDDVVLDGAKVERLSAPCLQVLLAAAKAWSAQGRSLTFEGASERLEEDLRLLGCDPATVLQGARAA